MEAVLRERKPMYAALQMSQEALPEFLSMNIGVIVNTHGKICVVHDEDFFSVPLWIRYKTKARTLEVLFDSGVTLPIDYDIGDSLDGHLCRSQKVSIVRVENNSVIESWETILLNDNYS